jgi:hypothetical protein
VALFERFRGFPEPLGGERKGPGFFGVDCVEQGKKSLYIAFMLGAD